MASPTPAWKEGILAEIDAKISGAPTTLPLRQVTKHTSINLSKCLDASLKPVSVLVSQKLIGAGYRIIQPFQTADRVILIDRGFVKIDQTEDLRNDPATVLGNLHGLMRWMNIPLNLTQRGTYGLRATSNTGKGIER